MSGAPSRPTTTSVTVTRAQADGLGAATGLDCTGPVLVCRPLVQGLLAVLDDPTAGLDPVRTRHAHVEIDLLAPVPLDTPLVVTATGRDRARLGTGDGLWIDVDVDDPGGHALVRSRHVVAAALDPRPDGRRTLPAVARPPASAPEVGRLALDRAALAAYRSAAGDTSTAHADTDADREGEPILPGLLVLFGAVRVVGAEPGHLAARFAHPLPAGASATVAAAGHDGRTALRVALGGRTAVRAVMTR